MSFGPSFHDNQPITWFRQLPIYATTIVTALLVLGMIGSVFLASARVDLPLAFLPAQFLRGALWQIVTYPFINLPNFFTALGILVFYSWGVQIEKYIGRAKFFTLLGLLVAAEAIACLAWYSAGDPFTRALGNYHITAALLIGFATLYPNIEYFGWIPLKWFAFVCVALGTLMYFPDRNWSGLTQLLATCGMAFGYIRWVQRGGTVELPQVTKFFRPQPRLRVLPSPEPRQPRRTVEENTSMAEIDALLDKIAQSGMSSLTSTERDKLERAREALMKKESGRP